MIIQFYLNDEDDTNSSTHIYTMYKMTGNPFKLDDIICLSVSDIPPRKYIEYNQDFQKVIIDKNENQKQLFHLKNIKLIKEGKYIDIERDEVTIEYHCEFVELLKKQ